MPLPKHEEEAFLDHCKTSAGVDLGVPHSFDRLVSWERVAADSVHNESEPFGSALRPLLLKHLVEHLSIPSILENYACELCLFYLIETKSDLDKRAFLYSVGDVLQTEIVREVE
jgi:hypothetical protein